jgi:hypothetical protein
MVVFASCPSRSNDQLMLGISPEHLRQETLAIGLAAISTGRPVFILLEGARIRVLELVGKAP